MKYLEEGREDPRVRRFLLPTRVVWTSQQGVTHPENLLTEGDAACEMKTSMLDAPAAILLDFGHELHGGVRLDIPTNTSHKPARVRVRFGESASEAMGAPNNDHTIHDQELLVPWMGHQEIGNTGFRFARIDLMDTETAITLRNVHAVFLYRPLPYRGSFECSDPLLNRIWETGAYTVHLCMQDHVWDGSKRDRLPWVGDMHPEAAVISAVFGAAQVLPESLDYVRDHTPLPGWMNGIAPYSIWWILIQHHWYRYHGNRDYLAQQRDYLIKLLEHLEQHLDKTGKETLDGFRFLEWPTSRDATAIDAGLQALMVLGLRAGAELCDILKAPEAAARARAAAQLAAACRRAPSESKQANALAVLAGMADAEETNRRILARDPYRGLSTFFGYYILQARALAGDYVGCLDLIRNYWGGMLKMGATTFWEGFDIDWMENSAGIDDLVPPGKRDIHADFGDYCYPGLRHSLCHGWAAGPTAWMSASILGVTPAAPGFSRVKIEPHLAGLEYARGSVPTPHGEITVSHQRRADGKVESKIHLPKGVTQEK